jgi:hypothetical protein
MFSYVFPAPHMEAALVYFSRLNCWDLKEFVFIQHDFDTSVRSSLDSETIKAIEAFNQADTFIFNSISKQFSKDISIEFQFEEDLEKYRKLVAASRQLCETISNEKSQEELLEIVVDNQNQDEVQCALLLMEPDVYEDYIMLTFEERARFEV